MPCTQSIQERRGEQLKWLTLPDSKKKWPPEVPLRMSAATGRAALLTKLVMDNIVSASWPRRHARKQVRPAARPVLPVRQASWPYNLSHTQSRNKTSTSIAGPRKQHIMWRNMIASHNNRRNHVKKTKSPLVVTIGQGAQNLQQTQQEKE